MLLFGGVCVICFLVVAVPSIACSSNNVSHWAKHEQHQARAEEEAQKAQEMQREADQAEASSAQCACWSVM